MFIYRTFIFDKFIEIMARVEVEMTVWIIVIFRTGGGGGGGGG